MITSLLVWVLITLVIPGLSPIVGQILHPIESDGAVALRKQTGLEELERERDQRNRELFDRIMQEKEVSLQGATFATARSEAEQRAFARYDAEVAVSDKEYDRKRASLIDRIDEEMANERNIQQSITLALSRLSPVSCFRHILASVARAGPAEAKNFQANAKRFQGEVKALIYDNVFVRIYSGTGLHSFGREVFADGFDPAKISLPELQYRYTTLSQSVRACSFDLVLLVVFAAAFTAGGFAGLRNYDVR